jgi:hypothetical protein
MRKYLFFKELKIFHQPSADFIQQFIPNASNGVFLLGFL